MAKQKTLLLQRRGKASFYLTTELPEVVKQKMLEIQGRYPKGHWDYRAIDLMMAAHREIMGLPEPE